MSGIYLYCAVPRACAPPAELRGLDAARVSVLAAQPISVWTSSAESAPSPTIEHIRQHHAVVARPLELGYTPIPLRFGQWLASPAEVTRRLHEQAAAFASALEAVAGAVEYGVRIARPGAAEPAGSDTAPARTGRQYLEVAAARLRAEQEAETVAASVADTIATEAGPATRRVIVMPATAHGATSIAALVERDAEPTFDLAMDAVRRRFPDLRFLVTGPWPPYSFGV
ncbi:MAG: GvpL/GvpF family gas vesicle protein [Longimicrobiales bacterium]